MGGQARHGLITMSAPKKIGRPAFKPTAAHRRKVEQMISCGDHKTTVARAIGISVPTLELHFAEELDNGWAKKRAEVLDMLFKSAKKGNVTAQRTLESMTRTAGAAADFDKPEKGEQAPIPRTTKRGKKEVQREEALNAGQNSEWGEDLAPIPGTRPN